MYESYNKCVLFILEGATESVFYLRFLEFLAKQNDAKFERIVNPQNDIRLYHFSIKNTDIMVAFYEAGGVIKLSVAAIDIVEYMIKNFQLLLDVVLCYDTDAPDGAENGKIDALNLIDKLSDVVSGEIISMTAFADIEDEMLHDLSGVKRFLGINYELTTKGRKGKAKMKKLYKASGKTYHEGERARELIGVLDFEQIIKYSFMPFGSLKSVFLIDDDEE